MQTVKKMDSCADLLQKCMEQGFSLASISMVTRIPEQEIKQLLDNKNYRLSDKEKENCLMVFLMQLCYEKPEDNQYYKVLLESLTQYFNVPPQAIANYIGISVEELSAFESSLKKDMIEKYIAHLFNTFVRDYRYS